VVEQLKEQAAEQKKQTQDKQKLLDRMVETLGEEEIKNLSDLKTLLQGKTLKQLIDQKEQAIIGLNRSYEKLEQAQEKQAKQLEQTNERLIFYQDNLKTKEGIIEDYKKAVELSEAEQTRKTQIIELAEQKVNNLETQLLQLAKQKLASKKEAKALVEQLETQ
jgi:hypothetical protein